MKSSGDPARVGDRRAVDPPTRGARSLTYLTPADLAVLVALYGARSGNVRVLPKDRGAGA